MLQSDLSVYDDIPFEEFNRMSSVTDKLKIAIYRFYRSDNKIICITPDETDGQPYTVRITASQIIRQYYKDKMKVTYRGVKVYISKI